MEETDVWADREVWRSEIGGMMIVDTLHPLSALDEWRRANAFSEPGRVPVLIENRRVLESLATRSSHQASEPEDILARASEIDLAMWLKARHELARRLVEDTPGEDLSRYMHEYGLAEESLEEGSDPHTSFSLFDRDAARMRDEQVLLVTLSADAPWMVFAELGWGDRGEHNPAPEVHCAMHRFWEDAFGAQVIGFGARALECRVRKPPTRMDAALELASAQAAYCPELLLYAFNSVEFLARSLLRTSVWSFRWD